MKNLNCRDCNKYLGEMEKGKVSKKSVILCTECMGKYETYKSLAEYKNTINTADFPDILKDMLNGKLK